MSLGLGHFGSAAVTALLALGFTVSGWHRGSRSPLNGAGIKLFAGGDQFYEALAQASVVVNLLPLTPLTRDILDADAIAHMALAAALVNVSRGEHIVDADLREALDNGRLHHAVLDVFREEPLPAGYWGWTHPRVTITPHVAAQVDKQTSARALARNIAALRSGSALLHSIDRMAGY